MPPRRPRPLALASLGVRALAVLAFVVAFLGAGGVPAVFASGAPSREQRVLPHATRGAADPRARAHLFEGEPDEKADRLQGPPAPRAALRERDGGDGPSHAPPPPALALRTAVTAREAARSHAVAPACAAAILRRAPPSAEARSPHPARGPPPSALPLP